MFTSEEIQAFVIIGIYMLVVFGPMMLADMAFNKRGREVAQAVCYITTGVTWSSVWVVGLIMSIPSGLAVNITVFSVLSAIGLGWLGVSIAMLISEVKKRRKVIRETLF